MYSFKIGMYLGELKVSLAEALDVAAELDVRYIWYSEQSFGKPFLEMTDSEVDAAGRLFTQRGMILFLLAPGNCFKQVHLADLDLETMEQHPEFRAEMRQLDRQMEVAAQLGVPAVNTFTFAWPGEYTAGKPTWPMRRLTRGGLIADVDMAKLVKGIGLMTERAEHHGVDREVLAARWEGTPGGVLELLIVADSFLRHMVRALVGTMLEQEPAQIVELLAGAHRDLAGRTASAAGLCLVGVAYTPDEVKQLSLLGLAD